VMLSALVAPPNKGCCIAWATAKIGRRKLFGGTALTDAPQGVSGPGSP
jgi:hypothetical protein